MILIAMNMLMIGRKILSANIESETLGIFEKSAALKRSNGEMLRFLSACLAALGALVVCAAAGMNAIGALIICLIAFFVTNGLGD
jgi:hypothetical protein